MLIPEIGGAFDRSGHGFHGSARTIPGVDALCLSCGHTESTGGFGNGTK